MGSLCYQSGIVLYCTVVLKSDRMCNMSLCERTATSCLSVLSYGTSSPATAIEAAKGPSCLVEIFCSDIDAYRDPLRGSPTHLSTESLMRLSIYQKRIQDYTKKCRFIIKVSPVGGDLISLRKERKTKMAKDHRT